ncbi:MAG: ribosome maturation factor RimM [Clostridiales bacterium]|jgi:16S rRNA processing protein RimM|nr:ribosome maturation factor RimM [Clostridiales bacterium]
MRFFEIGKIINTHGIAGELKIFPTTDDPRRFRLLADAYVLRPPDWRPERFEIESVRFHKRFVIVKFHGIDDINTAETFKNALVKITEAEALPLEEDEYYFQDIYDCRVVTTEGEELGVVTDILRTGANDVYVVRGSRGEILLPAVKGCVKAINTVEKTMTVYLMKGLAE